MIKRNLLKYSLSILLSALIITQTIMPAYAVDYNTSDGPAGGDISMDPGQDSSSSDSNAGHDDYVSSSEQAYNDIKNTAINNGWWDTNNMDEGTETTTTKLWYKQGLNGFNNYELFNQWYNTFEPGSDGTNYIPKDKLSYITNLGKNTQYLDPSDTTSYWGDLTDEELAAAEEMGMYNEDDGWSYNYQNGYNRLGETGIDSDNYKLYVNADLWSADGKTIAHNKSWYDLLRKPNLNWLNPNYTPVNVNYPESLEDIENIKKGIIQSGNTNVTSVVEKCLTDRTSNQSTFLHYNDSYMWYLYNNATGECVGCYFTDVPRITITFPQGDSGNYTIEKYQSYECQYSITKKYKYRKYLFADETLTLLCAYESEDSETSLMGDPFTQWDLRESESITTFFNTSGGGNTLTFGNSTTPFNTQQIK